MPSADFDPAQQAVGDAAFGATRLPPRVFATPRPAPALPQDIVADAAALGKHWSQSVTVWGGTILPIVTLVGPPALSWLTGIPLSAEASKLFSEQALQIAQAISIIAGAGTVL